jgi:hypothetical protein
LIGEQCQQPAALVDLRIEAGAQIANRIRQLRGFGSPSHVKAKL